MGPTLRARDRFSGRLRSGALRISILACERGSSDRYVQSLPGSGQYRLRADASGFDNLFLAGDWIDSGLNAGCIEAATLGGLQAGNAIKGKRLDAGTSGGYRPLGAGDPGAVARA